MVKLEDLATKSHEISQFSYNEIAKILNPLNESNSTQKEMILYGSNESNPKVRTLIVVLDLIQMQHKKPSFRMYGFILVMVGLWLWSYLSLASFIEF